MNSTLTHRGWVFTFGFVILVMGLLALVSPGIPAVEEMLGAYRAKLLFSGAFSFTGTGLGVMGLAEQGAAAKMLNRIGITSGSVGFVLILGTVLEHHFILS